MLLLESAKILNPCPHSALHRPLKQSPSILLFRNEAAIRETCTFAGRSKNNPDGSFPGRIEVDSKTRRENKRNSRRKSNKFTESFFYRLKNPNRIHADNFTEDQLNLIGLGYDRYVKFMENDDPNLRHPHDWYKYGEFGPYSWRGVVLGDPVPGKITDECVTLYSELKNHEEGEKMMQYEMEIDYSSRLKELNKEMGLKYYWVFVRHPKWRLTEKPWEQWTLASELVVEGGKKRIDKWSLMGRLGNKARKLITQCAAWFRPDIIYVKRPVYQCRFEPQEEFFKALHPFLDPQTERDVLFEMDGEWCTYYGGLCRAVKVSEKAFVDDVVNAYEKMSEERKGKVLEYVLKNNPVELLHPYTKEWKSKLEEMELGCDAEEEEAAEEYVDEEKGEFLEWVEEEEEEDEEDGEEEDDDVEEGYWKEKLRKDVNREVEEVAGATRFYEGQSGESKENEIARIGRWRRRVQKTKVPPDVFLPAAIRPFTYRNLVKEIVLLRHAILDGDVGRLNIDSH